jgi:hypothetical protein
MFKRTLFVILACLCVAIAAQGQTRLDGPTAVVNGVPGQQPQYCFEAVFGAGPDVCIQRTGPGALNLTSGVGPGVPIGGGLTSVATLPPSCTPGTQFLLPSGLTVVCLPGNTYGAPPGPVINALAFNVSPLLVDNGPNFTAAINAVKAAAFVPSGTPTFRSASPIVHGTSINSLSPVLTYNNGDTVLVCIHNSPSPQRTITVTDTGGSGFGTRVPFFVNGGNGSLVCFSTAPGGAKASTGITVTLSGGATSFGVSAIAYSNVGSFGTPNPTLTATGATATGALTLPTEDNNDVTVTAFSWFNGSAISASQNTGTLQQSFTSSASEGGVALATNTSATPSAGLLTNVTFSGATNWMAMGISLRSVTPVLPTLVIPPGFYNYSSGLSMPVPMAIECQSQPFLNYTGTAHAVDIGPTGLTSTNEMWPFFIKGCGFTGAASATAGLFGNTFTTFIGLSYNTFLNFGSPTAPSIQMQCSNWDVEYGPQNRFLTTDGIPRGNLEMNHGGCDNTSFLRARNNFAFCLNGQSAGNSGGCAHANAGFGFIIDGKNSRVEESNIAFLNPDVEMRCSNAPCQGNNAISNTFETATDAGSSCPIVFNGLPQDTLNVEDNTVDLHLSSLGVICPLGGTDTLSAAIVEKNRIYNIATVTPVVTLNNLTGQTFNQSANNKCSVAYTSPTFCVTPHTTGSNIAPWNFNIDDSMILGNATTVANLPAAAAGNAGTFMRVSDSTAIASEGQTCVGGSSNTALAFSNGTVWKCF